MAIIRYLIAFVNTLFVVLMSFCCFNSIFLLIFYPHWCTIKIRKEVRQELNERLKKLRKTLDMTQQAFADKLGVKRNTVGQWECGVNPLTDQTVVSICREFNVNENWLRTGEGDMFTEMSRDEQIEKFVGDLLHGEEDSFKRRLISGLAALDENGWKVLEDFLDSIQKKRGCLFQPQKCFDMYIDKAQTPFV